MSKLFQPRGHFYIYSITEDIIKNHINKNLYKYMEGEIFNEKYVHDDKIGGYSIHYQVKRSNIYYAYKCLL